MCCLHLVLQQTKNFLTDEELFVDKRKTFSQKLFHIHKSVMRQKMGDWANITSQPLCVVSAPLSYGGGWVGVDPPGVLNKKKGWSKTKKTKNGGTFGGEIYFRQPSQQHTHTTRQCWRCAALRILSRSATTIRGCKHNFAV